MDGEKEQVNASTKDTNVELPESKAKQSDSPMDIDPPGVEKSEKADRTENGKDSGLQGGSGDSTSAEDKADSSSVKESEEKKQKLDNSENISGDKKTESIEDETTKETVTFKVMFNKQKHDVTFDLDGTVTALKDHIQRITGEYTCSSF